MSFTLTDICVSSQGILPLSAIEVRLISQQDPSSPHMFEISGKSKINHLIKSEYEHLEVAKCFDYSTPIFMIHALGSMVDSKIFVCATAAETKAWMENIEDRRYKSLRQRLSPSHSALSYLVDLIQSCTEIYLLYRTHKYIGKLLLHFIFTVTGAM